MSVNFISFSSPIFTFNIGKDAKSFPVHSMAMAQLSIPMNNLINGSFREAAERQAVWEHVSPETFTRLCEFAYSGDYSSPSPEKISKESNPKEVEAQRQQEERKRKKADRGSEQNGPAKRQQLDGDDDDITLVQHGIMPWKLQEAVTAVPPEKYEYDGAGLYIENVSRWGNVVGQAFADKKWKPSRSATLFEEQTKVRGNQVDECFESVLLAHAELYVLASEKMMTGLIALCLHKIHCILRQFSVDRKSVEDIFVLIRYVFDDERTSETDVLRELLAEFVAWRVRADNIGGRKYFMDLMTEQSSFLRAFWRYTFWRNLAQDPKK